MESDRWDDFWQWHKRRFAAKASTVLQRLKVFGESVLKSQWSPPLFIPTMWVCFPSWEWPFPWRVHVIARLDGCLLWPFWPGLNFVEDEGTQEAMAASLLQDARWMLSVCVSWFKLLEAGIWTSYAFKSHDDDLIATNGSAEICGAKLPTSSSHLFHLVSIYATEIYWNLLNLYVFTPATDERHLAIIQVGEVGHLATASFGFTAVPIPIFGVFGEVASVDSASLVMELRLAFGQWHPGAASWLQFKCNLHHLRHAQFVHLVCRRL